DAGRVGPGPHRPGRRGGGRGGGTRPGVLAGAAAPGAWRGGRPVGTGGRAVTGGCGTGPRPDAGTGVGRRPRSFVERGSGTVLAVGVVSVLATLLLAGALVASVAVTGQRARTAADLAALAAVGEALTGAPQDRACKGRGGGGPGQRGRGRAVPVHAGRG